MPLPVLNDGACRIRANAEALIRQDLQYRGFAGTGTTRENNMLYVPCA